MLNIAISITFKLIILIMLLYILAYIVDIIYFNVYLYPKSLEEQRKLEKLLEDENVEIIDITVDDDLDKAVDEIIKKIKGRKAMNSTEFLENKITNGESMTVSELLTYIVDYITELNERLKVCEHMLYLDDEGFKNLKGWISWMNLYWLKTVKQV